MGWFGIGKIKTRIERWDMPDGTSKFEAHVRVGDWPMRHWEFCGNADTLEEVEKLAALGVTNEQRKREARRQREDEWRRTRCTIVKTANH